MSFFSSGKLLLLFCHSVVSYSLRPQGLKHARLPCPSLSPRVFSDSCPLSWWCYPSISSSASPFCCLQFFPASGSFPMNQFFASSGQITGASASASVLPMNIQDWFPLRLIVWSPCFPRDSQESSPALQFKSINPLVPSFLYCPTHIHTWLLERPWPWLYRPLLAKWCLCFLAHCLPLS